MIDPHVHLRDWEQKNKETVRHGLAVADKAGLDGVFEMPNTAPALTSRKIIEERIALADQAIKELDKKIVHGIFAGITNDPVQIKEVVQAHKELFPRVVGLKMFAGHSTGNMGIIEEAQQKIVYQTLAEAGYTGVLVVHCEKESFLKLELWDLKNPFSHTEARPPIAEVESVKDQIKFAQEVGFKGVLHICHISVPESLSEIEKQRNQVGFKITCGLTPHHAMLNAEMMNSENGLLLKMNPPLCSKFMQEQMLQALLDGRIDWIETDHAPHLLSEKLGQPFASGIPVLPYYPHFIKFLKTKGASEELLNNITHNNVASAFKLDIFNSQKTPDYNLAGEYEFDGFSDMF